MQETLKIKNVCQNIAERNSHVWACSTLNFLAVQVKLLCDERQSLRKTTIYNKGNNKITELRTIIQRESQNS